MFTVKWDIAATVKALQGTLDRLYDQRPMFRGILEYARKVTELNFATQGGRIGRPWRALTPDYEKRKAVVFPGKPILRATDELFKSLTSETADSIFEITKDSLTYGTSNRKGGYHQFAKRRPPRKFLGLNQADRKIIRGIVRAHLRGQSRANGFGV